MRASASVGPPAAYGTTIVTGRTGNASACAMRESAGKEADATAKRRQLRRESFMMHRPLIRAIDVHEGSRRGGASVMLLPDQLISVLISGMDQADRIERRLKLH